MKLVKAFKSAASTVNTAATVVKTNAVTIAIVLSGWAAFVAWISKLLTFDPSCDLGC